MKLNGVAPYCNLITLCDELSNADCSLSLVKLDDRILLAEIVQDNKSEIASGSIWTREDILRENQ